MEDNSLSIVLKWLNLPKHHCIFRETEQCVEAFVLRDWLRSLVWSRQVPPCFPHETLSSEEVHAALVQGQNVGDAWVHISIQVFCKSNKHVYPPTNFLPSDSPNTHQHSSLGQASTSQYYSSNISNDYGGTAVQSFCKPHTTGTSKSGRPSQPMLMGLEYSTSVMTYSQLLDFVSTSNANNLWKEACTKYKNHCVCIDSTSSSPVVCNSYLNNTPCIPYNAALKHACIKLYGCPIIDIRMSNTADGPVRSTLPTSASFATSTHPPRNPPLCPTHPNLLPAYCLLESVDCFLLLQPARQYTLYHCVNFSPDALTRSLCSSLFLLQQLLSLTHHLQEAGLGLGELPLTRLYVDSALHLTLSGGFLRGRVLEWKEEEHGEGLPNYNAGSFEKTQCCDGGVVQESNSDDNSMRARLASNNDGHFCCGVGDNDRAVKPSPCKRCFTFDKNDSISACLSNQMCSSCDTNVKHNNNSCSSSAFHHHSCVEHAIGATSNLVAGVCKSSLTSTACEAPCSLQAYLQLVSDPQALRLLKEVSRTDRGNADDGGPSPGQASALTYLTQLWCYGRITNLDYLLCLAYFAGREFGSPKHHPTLPWVIDFTEKGGAYRDLTKTKFRLTKGDQQLDITFQLGDASSPSRQVPPHHVTEHFSEITYYMYKARVTPKQVLQSIVRQHWVPEHYPQSIRRLYTTSPDECIPEFYTDLNIFKSQHPDLCDLAVPEHHGGSVASFLQEHRDALESPPVTAKLHHWLDLTYGYRLTGAAAVRSKNVSLQLMSERRCLSRGGVCQLFTAPHPPAWLPHPHHLLFPAPTQEPGRKSHPSECLSEAGSLPSERSLLIFASPSASDAPKPLTGQHKRLSRSRTSLSEDHKIGGSWSGYREQRDSTSQFGGTSMITLPKGYNPLAALSHVELLHQFVLKSSGQIPSVSPMQGCNTLRRNLEETLCLTQTRDIQVIGCLTVEMLAASKCRVLGPKACLRDRYSFCRQIVSSNSSDISRSLRQFLRMIFQLDTSSGSASTQNNEEFPQRFDPVITGSGMPAPSPLLILQPLSDTFPFPLYFPRVYTFVSKMREYSSMIASSTIFSVDCREKKILLEQLIDLRVRFASAELPRLLPHLSDEGLLLVAPYILELYNCSLSAVSSAWYLTDIVAEAFGPAESRKILLEPLIRLFDSEVVTRKHLKLFHRTFLLQLIVRFGLKAFLTNFVISLVEGVGGCKEVCRVGEDTPDSSSRKQSTTLRSVELNLLKNLVPGSTTGNSVGRCDGRDYAGANQTGTLDSGDQASIGSAYESTPQDRDLSLEEPGVCTAGEGVFVFEEVEDSDVAGVASQAATVRSPPVSDSMSLDDVSLQDCPASSSSPPASHTDKFRRSQSKDGNTGNTKASGCINVDENDGRLADDDREQQYESDDDSGRRRRRRFVSSTTQQSISECSTNAPTITTAADSASCHDDTDADTPTRKNFDDEDDDEDDSFVHLRQDPVCTFPNILSPSINIPGREKDGSEEGGRFFSQSLPDYNSGQRLYATDTIDIDGEGDGDLGYVIDETNEYFGDCGITSHQISTSKDKITNNQTVAKIPVARNSNKQGIPSAAILTTAGSRNSNKVSESATATSSSDDTSTVSDVCFESVLWLSQRLGPVLTAKYLTRNLLKMLTICYLPSNGALVTVPPSPVATLSVTRKRIQGDLTSARVLECLSEIACLYGEQVIMVQYISHVCDLIASCRSRKFTPAIEAGLIGCLALLQHILLFLSDSTFMACLQETLVKSAVYPVIRLLASTKTNFQSGAPVRGALAHRVVDIIYIMALRVGREMSKKILMRAIVRFLTAFDRVHTTSTLPVTARCVSPKSIDTDDLLTGAGDRDGGADEGTAAGATTATTSDSTHCTTETKVALPALDQNSEVTKAKALRELREVLTPELAYLSYYPLCRFLGARALESCLANHELLHSLCIQHDEVIQNNQAHNITQNNMDPCTFRMNDRFKTHQKILPTSRFANSSSDGTNHSETITNVTGNRIDISDFSINEDESPSSSHGYPVSVGFLDCIDISAYLSSKMNNTKRHLKGNWLAYWNHEIGRPDHDTHFNLNHIKLQAFTGHTNSIKNLLILENENSFLSCSKDKTVKLWSLRNEGDGSVLCPPQYTYNGHKKSVFGVTFCDRYRLVASCDSTVHIWDPFVGATIRQLDSLRHSPVTVLSSLPAPSSELLAATTDATLRVIDLRVRNYTHHFKVTASGAGLVRCVVCSSDGRLVCVAHSSGLVSVLDTRTGNLLSTWKPHEGEVLCVRWLEGTTFVSSALDQTVAVWNINDNAGSKFTLKGPTEPVHLLQLYNNQVISATTANRLGQHSCVSPDATYTSCRLRSDSLRGVVTAMELLPLNKTLLLGSDSGAIRLLA